MLSLMNVLKILLEAVVKASGNRPPVSSLAWTEMSGEISASIDDVEERFQKEEELGRPRRYRPVKTSSPTKGIPDQSVGSGEPGE